MCLRLSSKICSRCFTRHPTKKSQSVETLRREPPTNDSAHEAWTVSCGAGPQRKSSTQTYPAFCLGICDSLLPGGWTTPVIKQISLKNRIAGSKTNERKQQTSLHQSINPSIQLYHLYAITCTWVPLTQAVSAAEARGEPLPKKKRRLRGVKGRNFRKSSQSSRGKTLHLQKIHLDDSILSRCFFVEKNRCK